MFFDMSRQSGQQRTGKMLSGFLASTKTASPQRMDPLTG
jgi:hypothetical protein